MDRRSLSLAAALAAACTTHAGGDRPGDAGPTLDGGDPPGEDGGGPPLDGGDPPAPDGGGLDAGSVGCRGTGGAAVPFGSHRLPYAAGIRPNHVSQDEMDDAVRSYYATWKQRYLRRGCNAYYVLHDRGDTVSEAHGYGMLIMALMAGEEAEARTIFDAMVGYFNDHRSEIVPALMAWRQVSCRDVEGDTSATDGDLDIAYALLLADRQWGSDGAIDYRAAAGDLLRGIRAGDVDGSNRYLLLGDWTEDEARYHDATRPSDFMPGHLATFAAIADPSWDQLLDSQYQVIARAQTTLASSTGLVPDFVLHPLGSQATAPDFLEDGGDDDYEYNACRVPWRVATHYLTSGDTRGRDIVQRMNRFIKNASGNDPGAIRPGYHLDGSPLGPTYRDMAFVAPFAVAAMVDASHQGWLNDLWDTVVDDPGGGYYGDTIKMLSLIVLSGNWWAPEAAPCR